MLEIFSSLLFQCVGLEHLCCVELDKAANSYFYIVIEWLTALLEVDA